MKAYSLVLRFGDRLKTPYRRNCTNLRTTEGHQYKRSDKVCIRSIVCIVKTGRMRPSLGVATPKC